MQAAPGWPTAADGLSPAPPLGCSSTRCVSSMVFHTGSSLTDTPATSHLSHFLCLVPSARPGLSRAAPSCHIVQLSVSVSGSESPFAALRPKGENSTDYFTGAEDTSPTGNDLCWSHTEDKSQAQGDHSHV